MSDNQRVKITKMLLKSSLLKLLKEKSIYKISITEICQEADINRSTFYKHYDTEFALLKDIEDEYLSTIDEYISHFSYESTLRKLLDYVIENIEVFQLFLDGGPDNEFFQRLLELCFEKMRYEQLIMQYHNQKENEYLYRFIVFGALEVVKTWIADENRVSPAVMNDTLFKILSPYIGSAKRKE